MKKKLSCKICSKEFPTPFQLSRHLRTHTDEKSYSCEVCAKTFTQHPNLKRHAKNHSEEKSFVCKLCGRQFRRKDNLNVHIRVHLEDKQYGCDLCFRSFTASGYLLEHIERAHVGSKTHACIQCGYMFFTYRELASHLIVHTQDSITLHKQQQQLGSLMPPIFLDI